MKGLLIKDYINIKSYLKLYLIMILIFSAIALLNKEITMVYGINVFITLMLVTTSFSFDVTSKWDEFILTTPITKSDIVKGKYCLTLLVAIGSMILTLVIALVMNLTPVINPTVPIVEIFSALGVTFCITLIMMGLFTPFIFKFGPEKARLILFGGFALVCIVRIFLIPLMSSIPINKDIETILPFLTIGTILLITRLVFILSYRVSLKILETKELS